MLLSYMFDGSKRKRQQVTTRSSMLLPFIGGGGKKYISTPLEAISHRIKETVTNTIELADYPPKVNLSTDIEIIDVKIGSLSYKVRRVFLCCDNYQVGWIVDSDLQQCMSCEQNFNWMRFRHHCR